MKASNLEITRSLDGKFNLAIALSDKPNIEALTELKDHVKNGGFLDVEVKKYRKKRSLDSNGLLWAILGEMASILKSDKWSIYLQMLKRYGKYTYVVVKPNIVESMKLQWREIEEIGEVEINGQKGIQLLCYFGSSTYDTKEFSVLLDGVVSEAKEIGIKLLAGKDMEGMVNEWKKNGKN